MLIQDFLKNNHIEDCKKSPYSLRIGCDSKNELVIISYNQMESDFSLQMVQECRGVILENKTWNVVCHPFHKFFNFGESNAYDINFSKSIVMEKCDGSTIKIFFYKGEWRIATSKTIDAEAETMSSLSTFKKLFFEIIPHSDFLKLTSNFDKNKTYIMELIHPLSQIIVDYKNKKELVFIGLIENSENLIDYNIFHPDIYNKYSPIFSEYNIRYPKTYKYETLNLNDLAELADTENVNGNSFEGYVVTEILDEFVKGRVKIKSPKYLLLHRSLSKSIKSLIDIIVNNEIGEFVLYLEKMPSYVKDEYTRLCGLYNQLIEELEFLRNYYSYEMKFLNRKELAEDIYTNVPMYSMLVFSLLDNKEKSTKEIVKLANDNRNIIRKIFEK